jgi:outer membrane lipoprotein carrier protein
MKLFYTRFLYFIALFAFLSAAHAASPSEDLTSLLNSIQSMKANFSQTVYNKRGKATQKSYGRMAMQRPGKFRWDVTKPMPQLIIANGAKLWIYDADLDQVTIRSLKKSAGETPALLLSHDNKTLDRDFNVKILPKNAAGQWFALTPKRRDNMFESIQMGFVNNQIREMRLQDSLGSNTVIQFQNIQMNPSISAAQFSFKSSAKIDVIDETRKR